MEIFNDTLTTEKLFSLMEESESVRYFHVVFLSVVTATCLFGNSLLIAAILTHPKLRKPCNVYLVGLAITDLGFTLCHMLAIHAGVKGYWPFSQELCVADAILLISFSILSLCHITTIAVHRYLYVCKHDSMERWFTWKASGLIEFLTCLFGILAGTVPGIFMAEAEFDSRISSCIIATQHPGQWVYPFYLGILLLLVPVGLSLICYYYIYQKVKKIKRKLFNSNTINDKQKKNIIKNQLQNLLTRVVVFITFVLMYSPFLLIRTLDSLIYIPGDIHMAFALLCCANSMVNPIIYGLTSSTFRDAYNILMLRKLKCCCSQRNGSVLPQPHHENRTSQSCQSTANIIANNTINGGVPSDVIATMRSESLQRMMQTDTAWQSMNIYQECNSE